MVGLAGTMGCSNTACMNTIDVWLEVYGAVKLTQKFNVDLNRRCVVNLNFFHFLFSLVLVCCDSSSMCFCESSASITFCKRILFISFQCFPFYPITHHMLFRMWGNFEYSLTVYVWWPKIKVIFLCVTEDI